RLRDDIRSSNYIWCMWHLGYISAFSVGNTDAERFEQAARHHIEVQLRLFISGHRVYQIRFRCRDITELREHVVGRAQTLCQLLLFSVETLPGEISRFQRRIDGC